MWLIIYLWCTVALFIPYATIILLYRKWFLKLYPFLIPVSFKPEIKFSIIIPARNEESKIPTCLESIFLQKYPTDLFEVIVVDDHSTDSSSAIVQQLQLQHSNLKLIRLADEIDGKALNSYKKKAIERAIEIATGNWIITTDADCIMTEKWIAAFAAIIQQKDPVFVAAPVAFSNDGRIFSTFQYIDFTSLQGITAASVSAGFHSMCNGANLAYRKDTFTEVGGFKGIDSIASGDDMLLMNKIKKRFPSKIAFLFSREAIITTDPMPDWKSFLNQRIRWASKADQFKDKSIFWVLFLVYFFNLSLFIMPFLAFFYSSLFLYWLAFLVLKSLVELMFVIPVAAFFGQTFMWQLPLLQPIHIAYTVMAGWLGKFGTYHWKGRKVK